MATLTRQDSRQRRHLRIRRHIAGTADIPRASVCVSGKHIYVQLIDDDSHHTLAFASTLDPDMRKKNVRANVKGAEVVGATVAERALAAGITKVVFDRGGFKYHGKVKAIAEKMREAGLVF